MNITYFALKFLAPRAKKFEEDTLNPLKVQKEVLFEYLARNKDTEYGKKYNFAEIRSIEEYQSSVPLVDYEDLRVYAERMAKGEENILTSEKVIFFGRTSGTTGEPKLIPVTEYSRAKKADLMALWTYYISKDHPRAADGKILTIIDPEVKTFTESGVPCGPENGHAYVNLPAIVKRICAVPYETFMIEDYDARYYAILRLAMEQKVTSLATLNPSAIIILCQKIMPWSAGIIEDIEKGKLNWSFDIPAEIRTILEKRLKPNPLRAGQLRRILDEKGELLPKYFWPHMELIECWKGGTVRLYLRELERYFGNVPTRDFGCLSTEARSSIPISDEGAGGILAIDTNFYEFIPKEDIGKKDRRVFLCDQIEKGREYLLIVTTPAGLYRYDIDDVIRVSGFYNKTPVIEFVQKGQNAVSVTGEKVYGSHINEAVNMAADKLKLMIKFFSATVEMTEPPRYVFLVEFSDKPAHELKKTLLEAVEESLREENLEYDDTRNRQELGPPMLKVVKPGGFEEYRFRRVAEGAHETQFKIPELTTEADFEKNFEIEEEITLA